MPHHVFLAEYDRARPMFTDKLGQFCNFANMKIIALRLEKRPFGLCKLSSMIFLRVSHKASFVGANRYAWMDAGGVRTVFFGPSACHAGVRYQLEIVGGGPENSFRFDEISGAG